VLPSWDAFAGLTAGSKRVGDTVGLEYRNSAKLSGAREFKRIGIDHGSSAARVPCRQRLPVFMRRMFLRLLIFRVRSLSICANKQYHSVVMLETGTTRWLQPTRAARSFRFCDLIASRALGPSGRSSRATDRSCRHRQRLAAVHRQVSPLIQSAAAGDSGTRRGFAVPPFSRRGQSG